MLTEKMMAPSAVITNDLNVNVFSDEIVEKLVQSEHQRKCLSGNSVLYESKLCRVHNDPCIIFVSNHTILRGCLHDFVDEPIPGTDILFECNNPTMTCEKCYSDDCNKRSISGDVCVTCDSTENPKCSANTYVETDLHRFCPMSIKKLGCFHFQNGNHHIRGSNQFQMFGF